MVEVVVLKAGLIKQFHIKITRNASTIEELEAVIIAPNIKAANEIAQAFGEGEPCWPGVDRYVVRNRYPQTLEVTKVERLNE